MAASVTHATTAVGTDEGTGEIHKAEWNAGHSVSGVSLEGHDHDGSPEAKLLQANTHETPDTDSGPTSLHHTLGTGANQAASGTDSRLSNQRNPNDHTHAAGSGDGGVLTSPEVSAKILMDNQGGDPSSPASGKILVYTKAAGLFIKTSAGTVVGPMVDATGAGGLTNGTPGLTLGTTNVAGAASTGIATDATIALFDATTPANVGTAATGSAAFAAHRDHIHGTGAGTPSTQAFGDAAATGTGPAAAMTDHKHAMPANPLAAALNAIVATGQTLSGNNSFVDLSTTGPAVTITVNTKCLVILTCHMSNGTTASYGGMGFAASGANTIAAAATKCLQMSGLASGGFDLRGSEMFMLTGLTPGSTTFTAKYHQFGGAGTTTFGDRELIIVPLD